MLLLLLVACNKDSVPLDSRDSDGVVRDTEWVGADSAPPDDSDDSPPDSDDSGVDDTGEPALYTALTVHPAALVVSPGARWALRAVITDAEGARGDAVPAWSSSNSAVVSVDAAGQALAVGVGTATITAELAGLQAQAAVEVQADGTVRVQVLDGSTGLPLTDARVAYGSDRASTDAEGYATLVVPDGEAVDLTVFAPDQPYIAATVYAVVPRELCVALRPEQEEEPPGAVVQGELGLDAVATPAWDEVVVGLTGASMQRSPLFLDGDDLLAPDRTVNWLGVDFDLPGNAVLGGVEQSWEVPAWDGAVAVWGLAGVVPVAELSASLESPGQALALLVEHLDSFRYTLLPDLSANSTLPLTSSLTPDTPLDEWVLVNVPALPEGFAPEDTALTLVLEQHDAEGYTLAGFGHGAGLVSASRAPASAWADSQGSWVLTWAELGGAGSSGTRTLTLTPVIGGEASPEEFLGLPAVESVTGSGRTFTVRTDAQSTLVRAYVTSQDGGQRDLIFPAGDFAGVVHSNGPSLSLGRTRWSLVSVQTWEQTYEGLLSAPEGLAPRALEGQARRAAALEEEVKGS